MLFVEVSSWSWGRVLYLICKTEVKTICRLIEDKILWGLMTPGEAGEICSLCERRGETKYQTLEKIGSCSARGEINLLAFVAPLIQQDQGTFCLSN